MLTLTYLKISRISPVDFPFSHLANLWGNGALETYSRGLVSSFSSDGKFSTFTGRNNLIFFCHWHLHFVVDFFSFLQSHDYFDLSMLLWWIGTYFMHSFRIRHWLTWELVFLNSNCQGLNWRSKLSHHLLEAWNWLGLWVKACSHLIS